MAAENQPPEDSMQLPFSVGREVRRTMARTTIRHAQRRRLVHILAFAQLLVVLAAAPGYLGPVPRVGSLMALGAAAAVSVLAYLTDRVSQNASAAAYILVGGAALVTLAHMAIAALSGDPRATDQAALFFLPVIFAAGVLFAAEVIVLLVTMTMALTAAALFFSVAQGQGVPVNEIYLMMVGSVGLQALLGLIAWLVAQYLQESGFEVQRSDQLRFTQAQIESLQQQQVKQQSRVQAEIKVLQDAIARVLAGAHVTGVPVVPGELADLMQSFNLLLDYIHSEGGTTQTSAAADELTRQMLELIGQINDGATSVSSAAYEIDPRASGALGMVMQALLHLQTRSAHRNARLQELVSDVAGAVQTGFDGLGNTATDMEGAARLAGKLVSAASQLLPAIKTSHALLMQARDHVGGLLPPALLQAAAADAVHRDAGDLTPEEAARLLGRYDDLEGIDILDATPTGELQALAPLAAQTGEGNPPIPPLTMRLPAVESSGERSASASGGRSEEEKQAQLLELWRMLDRLVATLAYEYRTLQALARDLGKLSRSVRNTDSGVAHGIASLEAASQTLKDLQDQARPGRGPSYADLPRPTGRPSSPSRPAPTGAPGTSEPAPPPPEMRGLADDIFGDASLSDPNELGQFDVNQLIDADLRDGPTDPSGHGGAG